MRVLAIAALGAAFVQPAFAADCPIGQARYEQPGTLWQLQFEPVGQDAASNQTHAFAIAVPGTDKVLRGAVHQPNGYSQSLGSLTLGCAEEAADPGACTYWEGVVYVGGAGGIGVLDIDPEAPAPQQVLLPQLGAALWYSDLRQQDMPLDVFTFGGCGA